MCILPDPDPRGSATGPLCWIYTSPHLSLTPIFPSLFSVEQTETELPLLEQLLPACCIVARSCADLCRWVIVLPLFFFFFFLSFFPATAGM